MGDREHWNDIAARLRELPPEDRWRSPDFAKLYVIAVEDAPKLLNRWALGSLEPADLASELLSTKLHSLVEAEEPLPFFITCLRNRAKDWLKSPRSQVASTAGAQLIEDRRAEDKRNLQDALALLSPVAREIVAADCAGEDRIVIARRFNKKPNTIEQTIHRARDRLKKAGYP